MTDAPEILFVCVQNAGRSQMAAALALRLAGEGVRARSAGSAPATAVHPAVVEVMREIGIDLSRAVPTLLTPELARTADVIVTMGCGDACPVVPGKLRRDWKVDDPKGLPVADVRRIRDAIHRQVSLLLGEFGVDAT